MRGLVGTVWQPQKDMSHEDQSIPGHSDHGRRARSGRGGRYGRISRRQDPGDDFFGRQKRSRTPAETALPAKSPAPSAAVTPFRSAASRKPATPGMESRPVLTLSYVLHREGGARLKSDVNVGRIRR